MFCLQIMSGRQADFTEEHYGIRLLTVKLIILERGESRPGPVAKNATLGHPAGNRTRDLVNLVRCLAN